MPTEHPPRPADAPDGRRGEEERDRLTKHRGLATWGDRLVPLEQFRTAARHAGRRLSADERASARRRLLAAGDDGVPVEGPFDRVTVFGGIYNNHRALAALLEESAAWNGDALYCLGDFGGFGPSPEAVWPLLEQGSVRSIQGNYEESLSSGRDDCNCGYADPRDNHFAELSYRYTARNCSDAFKRYMGTLPRRRRLRIGDREWLLVHGSPRRINEFLFDSTTADTYLEVLLDQERCDGLLCTHTGLPWQRRLASGRHVVNVGALGRPANDGRTEVWYAQVTADGARPAELRPLRYDHESLAREMRVEGLPPEFVETIETGWWTTCLEILPAKERRSSRF